MVHPENFITANTEKELEKLINTNHYSILYFTAEWNISETISRIMQNTKSEIPIISLTLPLFKDTAERHHIKAVPALLLHRKNSNTEKNSEVFLRAENPDPEEAEAFFAKAASVLRESKLKAAKKNGGQTETPSLTENSRREISCFLESSPVVLLVEGNASAHVKDVLNDGNIVFEEFDVDIDDEIKKNIILYSSSNLFPQLYINGKLTGSGSDEICLKCNNGQILQLVPEKAQTSALNKRLQALINSKNIMCFMKGSPEKPLCGFSRNIVELLRGQKGFEAFGHFDILTDNVVREGLKKFSNWQTYPQLYVGGELVGGLDVVRELIEADELKDYVH